MKRMRLHDYKVFIYTFLLVYIYVTVLLYGSDFRKPVIQRGEIFSKIRPRLGQI